LGGHERRPAARTVKRRNEMMIRVIGIEEGKPVKGIRENRLR